MKAGFARIEITPEKQMPMAGYDRRRGLSQGRLDPLYASALLVGNKSPELVICSFDLLGMDSSFCTELGKMIGERLRLPPERIIICATHTHSGPAGIFTNRADYDREYMERLLYCGVNSAENAIGDFSEASVSHLPVRVKGVASPRNIGRRPGAELFEMRADTLKFSRRAGNIMLCTFACHPTVLNEQNLLFSRDLPGAGARFIRDGGRAIFLNGPCADLSTRYTRRGSDPGELTRLGGIWGEAVDGARGRICPEKTASVKTFCAAIRLSGRTGMDSEIQSGMMDYLRKHIRSCGNPQERREYSSRLAVLERGEYTSRDGKIVPVELVDLGCLAMLCLPLELSSHAGETCRSAAEKAVEKPVIPICYAGGYCGYLPSDQQLSDESCYEDLASPYSRSAGNELIKGIENMMSSVKGSSQKNGGGR